MYFQVQKLQGHREPEPQGDCCPHPDLPSMAVRFLWLNFCFVCFLTEKTQAE